MTSTVAPTHRVLLPQNVAPGESALSFLSRTAEANWYERLGWLRQDDDPGRRWDIGAWPADRRKTLAILVGVEEEAFEALSYGPHPEPGRLEDQRRFLGSRVPGSLLDVTRRKFCPLCLPVDGHHPALFDLTAVTVCPRHNVRLQDRCPICVRTVRWTGAGVLGCYHCKGELAWAGAMHVHADEAIGAAAIAQRAGFDLRGAHDPQWPAGTEHFDLGQAIELLAVLARLATDHRDRAPAFNFAATDANDRMRLGFEEAADWPKKYFHRLDRIAEAAKDDDRSAASRHKLFGFARVYGEFYNRLASASDEPWLFLRSWFAEYAAVQTITPITGRRDGAVFTAEDIADRPIITPREGRDAAGLKYYKMKRLLDAGAVPSKVAVGGKRDRVFVERADVEAVVAGGLPVGKQEAAGLLGVPCGKIAQLIMGGVLVPLAGPANDGGMRYMIARRDIDELVAGLRARVAPDAAFAANTTIKTVLRGQETHRTSCKATIDAMLDGTLVVRGWDEAEQGISGALFNNKEAERFLHLAHDRERGDLDGLTTLRVSHVLAIHPMAAVWLLKVGLLAPGPRATTKKPKVSRASVTAFHEECVTVTEIARDYRTNGAVAAKALAAAGLEPLCASEGEFSILVYDRGAVAETDLQPLIRLVGRRAGHTNAEYKRLLNAERRIGTAAGSAGGARSGLNGGRVEIAEAERDRRLA